MGLLYLLQRLVEYTNSDSCAIRMMNVNIHVYLSVGLRDLAFFNVGKRIS